MTPTVKQDTPANILTAELLIELPKRFPMLRVWRNNRVDAIVPGRNGVMRRISAGIDGQGDLSGVLGPQGTRVEIEIKAGKDKLSLAQRAFEQMITSHGGIYIVARSLDQCTRALESKL